MGRIVDEETLLGHIEDSGLWVGNGKRCLDCLIDGLGEDRSTWYDSFLSSINPTIQ